MNIGLPVYGIDEKNIMEYIRKIDFKTIFDMNDKDSEDIVINLKEMLNKGTSRAMDNIYIPILSGLKAPIHIDTSTKSSSTNEVYLNNKFNGIDSAVKKIDLNKVYDYKEDFGREKIIKIKEIIFEVIVNLIFYEITKKTDMTCPQPLKLYKDTHNLYYFQEQVQGIEVHELDEDDMLECLIIICSALKELQEDFHFSHRDFKSDNILYDTSTKIAYVIDFGFACISGLSCDESIQSDENSAGAGGICTNRSADICFLFLSIYSNMGRQKKPPFLKSIAEDIAKEYNTYDQNIVYKKIENELEYFTPGSILQRLYSYQSDDDYGSDSGSEW